MAVTDNTVNIVDGKGRRNPFSASVYSADASAAETIEAAPGATREIVLTHLVVVCQSDITISIGAGEAASAVETIMVGPLPFDAAGGGPVDIHFDNPLALGANKTLTMDASAAGAVAVIAEGYIQETTINA
jgi:hypothetical protein